MGADKLAENTPMPQNISAQFVRPSQEDWGFNEKRLHWESIVRDFFQDLLFKCKPCMAELGKYLTQVEIKKSY